MRDRLAAEKPEERERRLHQMSTKQSEQLEAEPLQQTSTNQHERLAVETLEEKKLRLECYSTRYKEQQFCAATAPTVSTVFH